MAKKSKGEFKEFRHHDKSAYTTIKIPLRSLLHNRKNVQPVINHSHTSLARLARTPL